LPKIRVVLELEVRDASPRADWLGITASPEGSAVNTKLQLVHCTDAPAGGRNRGSRSYCFEQ
jgi:hypothetical protein